MNNMLPTLKQVTHNAHYTQRYVRFIEMCQKSTSDVKPTELHHILPKSLFPNYANITQHPWNGIRLTSRQHYIAHLLLAKAYGGTMNQTLVLMGGKRSDKNSRLYEHMRSKVIQYMQDNNPCHLPTNCFKNKNPNKDGNQARQAWLLSPNERRQKQAQVATQNNKHYKSKPKEQRLYVCETCKTNFVRWEFSHHRRKKRPFCSRKCNVLFQPRK